jgi:hypothetical protein
VSRLGQYAEECEVEVYGSLGFYKVAFFATRPIVQASSRLRQGTSGLMRGDCFCFMHPTMLKTSKDFRTNPLADTAPINNIYCNTLGLAVATLYHMNAAPRIFQHS